MNKVFVVVALLAGLVGVMAVSGFGQVARPSDAWVPGLASFLVPGLGQFINDEVDKAIVHFGVFIAIDIGGWYLTELFPWPYHSYSYRYSIIGLAHLAWAVYSGLDAYNVAKEQGFTLGMTEDGLTLGYSF